MQIEQIERPSSGSALSATTLVSDVGFAIVPTLQHGRHLRLRSPLASIVAPALFRVVLGFVPPDRSGHCAGLAARMGLSVSPFRSARFRSHGDDFYSTLLGSTLSLVAGVSCSRLTFLWWGGSFRIEPRLVSSCLDCGPFGFVFEAACWAFSWGMGDRSSDSQRSSIYSEPGYLRPPSPLTAKHFSSPSRTDIFRLLSLCDYVGSSGESRESGFIPFVRIPRRRPRGRAGTCLFGIPRRANCPTSWSCWRCADEGGRYPLITTNNRCFSACG